MTGPPGATGPERDFGRFLTEQRNPRTMRLDALPLREALRIVNDADAEVATVVGRELDRIALAVELMVERRRRDGHVYFVGAGTSGRLGVIEAAEQTPTLDTPDPVYQAIVAGGPEAVFRSSEGAEDDAGDGAEQVRRRGVREHDVVVGIAASGTTPFVHGALAEAKQRGAGRVLIACNLTGVPPDAADVIIAPLVGPEVITGATRLRAATACKMVLNMMTIGTMLGTGKIYENLSVDVPKRSDKLVARARRIVRTLTDATEEEARQALEAAGYRAKVAVVMIRRGVDRHDAERILARVDGFLRRALEETP
ncbi:MAG TPA: N-acetylmuramic acid 6-phosphate etherase [Gemmatimonadaceae bacterium]|nr:N-acetylmuramic acid 6-phosphate etherase [Gemmatimonadaceae bacterium]